jgi:ATP-dependent Clp protease ATP-binding subunit ClpA
MDWYSCAKNASRRKRKLLHLEEELHHSVVGQGKKLKP